MLNNLIKEMKKIHLSTNVAAIVLEISLNELINKIYNNNEKQLSAAEMYRLKTIFFSDLSYEYLFQKSDCKKQIKKVYELAVHNTL